MKKIELTQGKFALVSDKDYSYLNQWKWFANKKSHNKWYAARRTKRNGVCRILYMHRFILGLTESNPKHVDHRDGNGLNNQRRNLRPATMSQNKCNTGRMVTNLSGFKGVSSRFGRWRAQITKGSRRVHLGYFTCPLDAAKAYDKAARLYYGEFARTNFKHR